MVLLRLRNPQGQRQARAALPGQLRTSGDPQLAVSARPATGRYGMKLDTSTSDYVECQQCSQRFVGGDFESRLSRWSEHADLTGCVTAKARRDQELAEQQP